MNTQIQNRIHAIYQEGLEKGADGLSGWTRSVYLLVELEIYNDMEGIEGFYRSKLAPLAVESAEALGTIGAVESSELVRKINALIGAQEDVLDLLSEKQMEEFDAIAARFSENPDNRGQKLEDFVLRTIRTE